MTTSQHPQPAAEAQATPPADAGQWAILELMGHTRMAGRISEAPLCGATVLRVDVPEVTVHASAYRNGGPATDSRRIPAPTKLLTLQAVYALNPVDEATATAAAHLFAHEPVSPYTLARAIDRMDEGCLQRMLHPAPTPSTAGAGARGSA